MLRHIKGKARVCAVVAPAMMMLEVFSDLQQPTLMSNIIDKGVANGDIHYVLSTGLTMVLIALLGGLGGAICGSLASVAAMNMSGNLRQDLFEKIQGLSFAEVDRFKTSSLITRLTNDVIQLQALMLMMLRIMVRSPLICLGGVLMAFLLSPGLSVLFCIVLPIIIVSIVIVIKKTIPMFSVVQSRLDKVNTVMRETLLGIRVVKSFTIEDRQFERFCGVNEDLTQQSIRAQSMTMLLMPIVTLVMNLGVVSVLWFGGRMYMVGGIELGKIMAFVNYMVQITNSLTAAVNLVVNISRAQASSDRVVEVLGAAPSIADPQVPERPEGSDVEFRNVSFRYEGAGEYALKNISLRIGQGETVGVIGATGSGKSTLVSLIPRLYDASEGQVLIGGADIRSLELRDLSRRIGIVLQESVLISGTVRSNMQFGSEDATEAEIESAEADAQALDFIKMLPKGNDSPVEQRGQNFSGGQKQRLSIARTLLREPDVLILDDSTSAVDLRTEAVLRDALAERLKGRTLILIAQRISAVMDADRIFVLDNGEVSASGSHAQLLRTSEIYRSIAVSQLGEEVLSGGE